MNKFKRFDKKTIKQMKTLFGEEKFKIEFKNRRKGKTTGIAYQTIGFALLNPGIKVEIKDHYNSRIAHASLMQTIYDIVEKNNLQGFTFNKTKFTLVFDVE